MKKNKKPVIIIGGGLAGLTAANYLHENGIPFLLFEAGDRIAGLAKSFNDDDGFSYDFGAHFVTNRLAEMIGIGDTCRDVPRYGESVWLKGRSYGYPFGLMRNLKFAMSGIKSRIDSITGKSEVVSASDWYRASYGNKLANEIAIPLTEAWSGAKGSELASSVGDSIPGSMLRTVYLKMMSKLLGKAVCSGYSRELPETAKVWHVYPEGGVGALCEKLAEGLHDSIKLSTPVSKILVEDERAVGVIAGGERYEGCAVVSTAPVHILPKIIEGSDRLDYLERFKYRPMTFVNMRFEGRNLIPDVVMWTPESDSPYFRVTETPVSMPWLAPEGKTLITADIGCEKGDEFWNMDDKEIGELCLKSIKGMIPDAEERYLGCRVLRTPLAYPVFLAEYEADRQRFEKGTGINGLYSIGRNGEFRHVFMEDAYVRGRRKMAELIDYISSLNQTQELASEVTENRPEPALTAV
jgi:protoporphyrinogen oxidase